MRNAKDRVLLVDDEPGALRLLGSALRGEAFEIVTAASAEEALEICRSQRIAAVVTDHEMPGMTGRELVSELRRRDPLIARFILTGRATLELALSAINEGAVHRLFIKPCAPAEIASALRLALQQRRLLDESRRLLEALRREPTPRKAQPTGLRRAPDGVFELEEILDDFDGLVREIERTSG